MLVTKAERVHEGRPTQQRVDRGAQRAGAFPVDEANFPMIVCRALGEVGGNQFAKIGGAEGVQVELTGDRERNGRSVGVVGRHGKIYGR